jgi:hypothetical protein
VGLASEAASANARTEMPDLNFIKVPNLDSYSSARPLR